MIAMKAIRALRRHGLRNVLGWAWFAFCERYYEWWLGISTARSAIRETMPEDCKHYEPLPYMLARAALNVLGRAEGQVLLDYGSGLGRVVLLASQRPFSRVTGIDLNEDLVLEAHKNRIGMGRRRSPLAGLIEFITADATAWRVPDDVTIIFLFNPFVGQVMEEAQKRIAESLARRPRQLRIVYAHAFDQRDLFAHVDWLKHTGQVPTGVMKGMSIELYESVRP